MKFILFSCVIFLLEFGGSRCEDTCNEDENVLESDKWYRYSYKIIAETASVGSTDDVAASRLDCSVKIARTHPCHYAFQVEECLFAAGGGPPGEKVLWMKDLLLEDVARRTVLVTISHGQVQSIAVPPDEPQQWQNIRRALISAFVLKKSHLQSGANIMRTDVQGTCPWKMLPLGQPGFAKSEKDMLHCHFPSRPDCKLSPWSLFWNMTFIQYLINSTVECEHKADKTLSYMESVTCHERHAIKLESTHNTTTAVQTNVLYIMKIEDRAPLHSRPEWASIDHPTVSSGIVYVHTKTADPSSPGYSHRDDLDEAIGAKFSQLLLSAQAEVGLYTIDQFQDLVELLRSSPDLIPFAESVVRCEFLPSHQVCTAQLKELALAYLLDALVQSNNYPTLRALRHLVTESHVSDAYMKLPFHSWQYIKVDDSRYLEEVFEICKWTEARMCWLVLGRMAKNHFESSSTRGIPAITKRIFEHVLTYLRPGCGLKNEAFPPALTDAEKIDFIITMLKTVRNGAVTAQLSGVSDSLLGCAQNPNLPIHVRVVAIEALHGFHLLHKGTDSDYLKDKLLRLLADGHLPSPVKIALYKVITSRRPHVDVIKGIERDPDWTDVKDYVVSDYLDGIPDALQFEFFPSHKPSCVQFLNRTTMLWRKWTHHHPTGKLASGKWSLERLLVLPFLPKEIGTFGLKLVSEYISSINSSFAYISKDLQLTLAGKRVHLAEIGAFLQGFERYLAQGPQATSWVTGLGSFLKPRKTQFLQNLPALHESLREILSETEPELSVPMSYLRMFGSDMAFSSFNDIPQLLKGAWRSAPILPSVESLDATTFNLTRTIRFVEAYLTVPTLMGLPLNWTTKATLAVSFRSGLEAVDRNTYSVFFHPSAALTFLNGMVLDFPTVTKIGVQANSSAYSSTQMDVRLRSKGSKIDIEILRPSKEQKVLMLKRSNQLIKHTTLQEMTDWDVERVRKYWCSKDDVSTAVGLRTCVELSYADVTHRMKPWFLMAGSAHWNFILAPHLDSLVNSYVVSVVLPDQDMKQQSFRLNGYIQGAFPEKLVTVLTYRDRTLELIVPVNSSMHFKVKQKYINGADDDHSIRGNQLEISYSIAPDHAYVLSYMDESKSEKRILSKGPTKLQHLTVTVDRKSWILRFPGAVYSVISVRDIHSNGVKSDIKFLIERRLPTKARDSLSDIVPGEFWENDNRAWLHVQNDWQPSGGGRKRKTSLGSRSYLLTPRTTVELLIQSGTTSTHRLYHFNLTHSERGTGRLLAFANFTHRMQQHRKGHWRSIYNLTVPHHSWELQMETKKLAQQVYGMVAMLSEEMIWKELPRSRLTAWWHPSTSHLFEGSRKKVELRFSIPSEDLWPSFENAYLHGALSVSENGREQQMFVCHANRTSSNTQQKVNVHVRDSVHDTRWATEGTLSFDDNNLPVVSVFSAITSGPADDRVATYQLELHNPLLLCPLARFSHSMQSDSWQYAAKASAECTDDIFKGELVIRSDSHVWDFLRMNLNQTLNMDRSKSVESMNMTYALGTINVDASWDNEVYTKNGFFSRKGESVPFLSLHLTGLLNDSDWSLTSHLMDTKMDLKLRYYPFLSGPAKLLTLHLHPLIEAYRTDPTIFALGLVPQPSGKSLIIVSHPDILRNFLGDMMMIWSVLNDKESAVNEILQPVIRMPIGLYAKQQVNQFQDNLVKAASKVAGVASSLKSLHTPYTGVLLRLAKKASNTLKVANLHFKQTIPGWAFYYFNANDTVDYMARHIPQVSWTIFKGYYSRPIRGSYRLWTFHPPRWLKIIATLKLDAMRYGILHQVPDSRTTGKPRLQGAQKMAAIFGADHVMTFDGFHWVFPEYPASYCTYLLAHHKTDNLFTLTTSKEDVTVDYQDVNCRTALTVTGSGQVKLNGTKEPLILPFESPSRAVKVFRDGTEIRIDGPGLDVLCDPVKFFCIFILDAASRGALVGILGNADGNKDNDFTLPDGSVAADVAGLAMSYELGKRPECLTLTSPDISPEKSPQCRHHMVSKECLAATMMDDALQEACTWDLGKGRSQCERLNFLTAACWYHGFTEGIRQCSGCAAANSVTGTINLKTEKVVEIVLLVDASSFDKDQFSNIIYGIKHLVMHVDTVFLERGYVTKYALISNHKGSPSFCGSTGDVFVQSQDAINSLLKTLTWEHAKSELDFLVEYGLDYAPFHPKASHVLLALAASDFNTTRSRLDGLVQKLESSGATLFAFSTYPTIDRGKKVFGVRADGLIFPTLSKEAYLIYPSRAGILAKLAAATKGSIYQQSFVAAGEPATFFRAVSQEMMAKVGKEIRHCAINSNFVQLGERCFLKVPVDNPAFSFDPLGEQQKWAFQLTITC